MTDDELAEAARKELEKGLEPVPPDDRDLPQDVETGDPTEGE